ncbi:MAG TPA: hypothetical protein VFZ59_23490 [Verrucomicrobiae bacterium]|nr:hypothetical protein [Verrucomicrobiae bacterium]
MKTALLPKPRRRQGSSLLVTLLVTLLLGVTLASYLMLVRSEHVLTARSQAWHQALVMAEAGVEEALAQLNPGAFNSEVAGGNGWSLYNGFYQPDPAERSLIGGRYAVVYTQETPPTIYSTGYTAFPSGAATLSRVVRVTTTNAPLYIAGVSAAQITNPANYPVYLDTYDSEDPDYSDNGAYSPAKAKSATQTNAAALGQTEYPDVLPPFATGLTLPSRVGNTYTLSGSYFVNGNLSLPNYDKIYVPAHRTADLYVTGDFFMATEAEIEIAETGILRIFVGGRTAVIDYVNNHGTPQSFQYYGLPGNTNVTFAQITPTLAASVYAPNANFVANYNADLFDFSGSLVVQNLILTRPFKFHFDESLARNGPKRGFVASSWQEL